MTLATRDMSIQMLCAYKVGFKDHESLRPPDLLPIRTVTFFRPSKPDQHVTFGAHEQSPHRRKRHIEGGPLGGWGSPHAGPNSLPKSI